MASACLHPSRLRIPALSANRCWIRWTWKPASNALRFRAWHRGTREADLLIGGFFDAHHAGWTQDDAALFEALLEEQDVDIMAWAMGTAEVPERYQSTIMSALKTLNYVPISR